MGKILEFSINCTNGRCSVYYPGERVSGNVALNLKEPMKMQQLKVQLIGETYCHWKEVEAKDKIIVYQQKDTIFKEVQNLFGIHDGSTISSHPAGVHMYEFSFLLPSKLPSSFEGEFGHIRYILKATVVKPWKFNHKVKLPITVNELIDTNNAMYSAGRGGEQNKLIGCFCGLAGGPLDMTANIDRSCYCPGETILINANVINLSSRNVNALQAKLVRTVTYSVSGKSKIDSKTLCSLVGPPVQKGQYAAWSKKAFSIPPTPPTIRSSSLIKLEYTLKLSTGVPCGEDPVITIGIVIGTVPHLPTYGHQNNSYPSDPPPHYNACVRTSVEDIDYPVPSVFGYPGMAPPSYSSAMGEGEVSIRQENDIYTYGELQYRAMYTFALPYNNQIH